MPAPEKNHGSRSCIMQPRLRRDRMDESKGTDTLSARRFHPCPLHPTRAFAELREHVVPSANPEQPVERSSHRRGGRARSSQSMQRFRLRCQSKVSEPTGGRTNWPRKQGQRWPFDVFKYRTNARSARPRAPHSIHQPAPPLHHLTAVGCEDRAQRHKIGANQQGHATPTG